MDKQTKQNLEWLEELGFNVKKRTYDQCVADLIGKFIEMEDTLFLKEEERFRKETFRLIKTPTN